jgi:hypothetical protein
MQNNVVYKHKLLWQSVLTFAIYTVIILYYISHLLSLTPFNNKTRTE